LYSLRLQFIAHRCWNSGLLTHINSLNCPLRYRTYAAESGADVEFVGVDFFFNNRGTPLWFAAMTVYNGGDEVGLYKLRMQLTHSLQPPGFNP
jgi:hypothetical protein